jgi:hypothetical protein
MDYNLFIQPTFLSGVLIYDDEGSFINCVHYWVEYFGEDRPQTPIII